MTNKQLETAKELETSYKNTCNKLVVMFAKKQGLYFDGWVADDVGSIAGFNEQYFFSIDNIRLDLYTNQKKGFILEWQISGLHEESCFINYESYIGGLRYPEHK
jgi:hypothetical protein